MEFLTKATHAREKGENSALLKTFFIFSKATILPATGIQLLPHDTILLGQDRWADGQLSDYQNSRISLNDSRMFANLFQEKILGKFQLLEKMQQLADQE